MLLNSNSIEKLNASRELERVGTIIAIKRVCAALFSKEGLHLTWTGDLKGYQHLIINIGGDNE